MTRKEAEELVERLLQDSHDYENAGWGRQYLRDDYFATKEKVIAALTTKPPPLNG